MTFQGPLHHSHGGSFYPLSHMWFPGLFSFYDFFFMWAIFKIFIEFVTILVLFYVLVPWLQGKGDLTSLTRDPTHTPCIGRQSLKHWTAREVPASVIFGVSTWWVPGKPPLTCTMLLQASEQILSFIWFINDAAAQMDTRRGVWREECMRNAQPLQKSLMLFLFSH